MWSKWSKGNKTIFESAEVSNPRKMMTALTETVMIGFVQKNSKLQCGLLGCRYKWNSQVVIVSE